MHVAAILKMKGRNVVTTTADKSLLDVAKLLEQHDIGCIVDDAQVVRDRRRPDLHDDAHVTPGTRS